MRKRKNQKNTIYKYLNSQMTKTTKQKPNHTLIQVSMIKDVKEAKTKKGHSKFE